MTPSTGVFALGLVCLYLSSKGSLLDVIWLSLAIVDTFRALRTIRANGRRVGVSTRRRAMKEALMSWIASTAITQAEPVVSKLLGWLPFYAPLRWIVCLTFIAIRTPVSNAIYISLLRPLLRKYETPIDLLLLLFHSVADIVIYYTLTYPLHIVHSTALRLKAIVVGRRPELAELDNQAAPIVVDDVIDESANSRMKREERQAPGDMTLSTPLIPGRLLRSIRKPLASARAISRAEVGESSSSPSRSGACKPAQTLTPLVPLSPSDNPLQPSSSSISQPPHPNGDVPATLRSRKRPATDLLEHDSVISAASPAGIFAKRRSKQALDPARAVQKAVPGSASSREKGAEISPRTARAVDPPSQQMTHTASRLYPDIPLHAQASASASVPLPRALPSSSSHTARTIPPALAGASPPIRAAPAAQRPQPPKTYSRPAAASSRPTSTLPPSRLNRPAPSSLRVHSDTITTQPKATLRTNSTSSSGSSGSRSSALSQHVNRPFKSRTGPASTGLSKKTEEAVVERTKPRKDGSEGARGKADQDKARTGDAVVVGRKRAAPDTELEALTVEKKARREVAPRTRPGVSKDADGKVEQGKKLSTAGPAVGGSAGTSTRTRSTRSGVGRAA